MCINKLQIMEVFESILLATYTSICNILLASQTGTVLEGLDDPLSGTAGCCLKPQSLPVFQGEILQFFIEQIITLTLYSIGKWLYNII